jgi:uncharacterized protein YaiI (UPF0178 family)
MLRVCNICMKIWIDADACPRPVKEIVFRAAERRGIETILVANQFLRVPPSRHIRAIQVSGGFDVADDHIAQHADTGDLVITADIPLAAALVEKRVRVLSPRGQAFTDANVRQQLAMRDFMDTMRGSGVQVQGGPPAYGDRDKQAFANALDRLLSHASR